MQMREEGLLMGADDEFDALYGESHGDDVDDALEIERLADGVRFILPPPGMGTWKVAGWTWVIVGNVLIIGGAAGGAFGQHALAGNVGLWVNVGIWVAVGSLILIGLLFVDSGLTYLFGQRTIDVRGTTLFVTRQAGLVRIRRRLPLVRIRKFRVALAVDTGDNADMEGLTAALAKSMHYALYAELESGAKKKLVQWLSYDHVCSLATELARAIERHYAIHGVTVEPPTVDIDMRAVEQAADDAVERPLPAESEIEVKENGDELSIIVPKLPLFRGKGSQSVAGMFLSTLGAAAVGIFIFSGGFSWVWIAFLAPAALTWGKFLVDRVGERETYIDVVNSTVLVSYTSIRGVKHHRWAREQIKAIRRGKSDLQVNDKHLPQLEIIAVGGELPEESKVKKHGILVGRTNEEITWVAWKLRQALGVPASAPSDADEEDDGDGAEAPSVPDERVSWF
jgi:hypothetical protein